MERAKQSFGEQAARFSLYAPFVVLAIGLFLNASPSIEPSVAISIFAINAFLVVSGFILGILALFSMRKYGRNRILARATVGVSLNGTIIVALLVLTLPLVLAGRIKDKIVGHWHCRSSAANAAVQIDLTFNKDGSFHSTGTGAASSFSLDGHWVFTKDRVIGMTVERAGEPSTPLPEPKKFGLGTVKEIDDQHMLLGTDKGNESYDRLP